MMPYRSISAWRGSQAIWLTLLIASMACWLERLAASQIEYLKAENRALRWRIWRGRILFTDPERRTLGALAKEIGIKALRELDPLVSPATLLRWHRELVAQKWTFLERLAPGSHRTAIDIEQLIVRIAHENPSWGYTRIYGLEHLSQGSLPHVQIGVFLQVPRLHFRMSLRIHQTPPSRWRRPSWP